MKKLSSVRKTLNLLTANQRRVIWALVFVLMAVEITALVRIPAVAHAATLATTHQPEPLTELYFNNHEHLPKQLAAGSTTGFSFHITNHEAKAVTYQYRVVSQAATGTITLGSGSVTLNDGQGADKTVQFVAPAANQPAEIEVVLIGRSEHIDFWTVAS